MCTKRSTTLFANLIITAIRDHDGRLIGFGKVTRDITQRFRVETALRESEERYSLLVEGVKDYAILMVDPGGQLLTWYTGVERLKGYSERDVVGQSIQIFYSTDDVASGKPWRMMASAVAEGSCEDQGWRVRNDRSRFYADVVLATMRNQAGDLIGFTKITRDITERKFLEDRLWHAANYDSLTSPLN